MYAPRSAGRRRSRAAFTLVELLVVIAILGMLIALLLPAANAARESARIMSCANNLRSLGQAFRVHIQQNNGYFPSGGQTGSAVVRTIGPTGTPANYKTQAWGWGYQILPYIDQDSLWSLTTPDATTASVTIAKSPLPIFFCTSRRRPVALSGGAWQSETQPRGMCDYAANGGSAPYVMNTTTNNTVTSSTPDGDHAGRYSNGKNGIMALRTAIPGAACTLDKVTDGESNTMMLSEKRMNRGPMTSETQPDDNEGFCAGYQDDTIRWGDFVPDRDVNTVNDPSGNPTKPRIWQFGSSHVSGMNSVFCDASVQFIGYSIDPDLFRWICVRNDKVPVNLTNLR